ncbi:hypothetical protein ONS95_005549 [Cadophora gregata]|uniref:uncharacterized protein n=1 Tax=Cadophora gregata TaxID=51156 RepID=UPI0026DAD47E|nr:uncharacterized protein ONS95_005549 [Cadophora gregata]KAK0103528.1 hypothetical protein ONS95_005549 [Cadophora gregata]KAK0107721.1 hypothetical protein ONS96_003521 [Cadophora gregata f. sp. sojae]
MSTRHAPQACVPCRTLKRKCTKELPSCSLCRQLRKECGYPTSLRIRSARPEEVTILSDRVKLLEQRLSGEVTPSVASNHPAQTQVEGTSISLQVTSGHRLNFPTAFFLDLDYYRPMPSEQLNPNMFVPPDVLHFLESKNTMQALFERYLTGTQKWLPILWKRRTTEKINSFSESMESGLVLLLLCMKMVTEPPRDQDHAASTPLYRTAKGLCFRLENSCAISLYLLQAIVFIAVYELGHGIFPAAQLTIAHAARLGIIMGLHDRKHAPQLFKDPDTYNMREEERRTWWAIIILERYMSLGTYGQPLATPEPHQGALLPSSEDAWDTQGGCLGSNFPLFASSFTPTTDIGSYASTCQAAHILGLVLRHRDELKSVVSDTHYRITEAQRLHQTLVLLNQHLAGQVSKDTKNSSSFYTAMGLCYAARVTLYNLYACNEHYSATEARIAEETEMQRASIEGLKEVTQCVYRLAQAILDAAVMDDQLISRSLLLTHSLYFAASELGWFIKEMNYLEDVQFLKGVVELLKLISKTWRVAEHYLKVLEEDGSLASLAT